LAIADFQLPDARHSAIKIQNNNELAIASNRHLAIDNRQSYLVSLWPVCLRQRRQNF
jgi:hypothetical protein